jgi:hypothetical protein
MAEGRDCEELSPNARKIFDKIKPYFPPDPWNRPQWTNEGLVYANGWCDLSKSSARKDRIQWEKNMIGYLVGLQGTTYKKRHGSLDGFTSQHYSRLTQHHVELLLLYEELDYQIETGDFTD